MSTITNVTISALHVEKEANLNIAQGKVDVLTQTEQKEKLKKISEQ